MNSYTASNGVGLTITRDRAVRWRPGIPPDLVSSALREYFQAERDDALGRWRDPENPNIVVYPRPALDDLHGRRVWLLDEHSGEARLDWEHIALPSGPARRYFQDHPEPKPRPWEEAKPGDIWVLTRWGTAEPFLVEDGEFITDDPAVIVDLDDDSITAGRRIWSEPEPEGGDTDE